MHIRSTSLPQRLLLAAGVAYAVDFSLLIAFGNPELGVGQAFYLPVVLAALAGGVPEGAAAGAAAIALYEAAELLAGGPVWSDPAGISVRFVSYLATGATVGWFARRARRLLAESLYMLDELLVIAERDAVTGLRKARGFEEELDRRLSLRRPFALLVLEAPRERRRRLLGREDEAARELARLVAAALEPDCEVASLGQSRLAALVPALSPGDARAVGDRLERALHCAGRAVSVGWAFHPADGGGALGLFGAAVERLQARRIVRGEWEPTAASAGLVEAFAPRG